MTRHQTQRTIGRTAVVLGLALAFAGGALATAGASDGKIPDKTKKQIRVMEGMLDSILLDSPNLLVAGSHVTHGVYLDEFGVVLAFEASLTGGGLDFGRSLEFLKNIRVESDKDKTVIWHEKSKSEDAEEDYEAQNEDDDGSGKKEEEKKVIVLRPGMEGEDAVQSAKETYEKGRQELVDALVDYGETLTSLRDDQWVAIAAFLKDNQYFSDQKISRLVIKAHIRDLRASGQMSRDALLGRMVIEEY
jgi:hypothetical protein